MALPDKKTLEIVKRLQNARLDLLRKQPFYALLLMHMKFALDNTVEHSYTDGNRICFNPDFLCEIDDGELEFVLMHNVLHAALSHPFRVQADYDLEVFDKACDIVVNSNILYSFGGTDLSKITLKKYGVMPHRAPSGKEGYELTLEQVYNELMNAKEKSPKKKKGSGAMAFSGGVDGESGKSSDEGEDEESQEEPNNDSSDSEQENDSNSAESNKNDKSGKEKSQKGKASNAKISSGGAYGGKKYDSLEAIKAAMLAKNKSMAVTLSEKPEEEKQKVETKDRHFDDHSFWEGDDEDKSQSDQWNDRVMRATDMLMEKEDAHVGYGGPPLCAQRLVKGLREPKVDWRALLNTFVQEEINDYSFSPPDKRMDDSPFFLPDFNEKEESVKNIWFLIDTSGSIGDKQISAAYSEIISAMEAFNNKLEGLLSFTEVFVTEPIPFCDPEELLSIVPVGGGGNDFGEIFRYMQKNMMDNLPASIVILTDGYDRYPDEKEALDVPVLWLINNQEAPLPPWGKCARFKVNEETKG